MRPKNLAKKVAQLALEKKADDVVILNVKKLTKVADYFVICSAESGLQVKAVVDHITEELEKRGIRAWHIEGYDYLRWVLIDYVDVVVHVFLKEMREFYGLERFWGDAKFEYINPEKGEK